MKTFSLPGQSLNGSNYFFWLPFLSKSIFLRDEVDNSMTNPTPYPGLGPAVAPKGLQAKYY
ncbi:unnamed protein product, partial [Schistosoma bovis]